MGLLGQYLMLDVGSFQCDGKCMLSWWHSAQRVTQSWASWRTQQHGAQRMAHVGNRAQGTTFSAVKCPQEVHDWNEFVRTRSSLERDVLEVASVCVLPRPKPLSVRCSEQPRNQSCCLSCSRLSLTGGTRSEQRQCGASPCSHKDWAFVDLVMPTLESSPRHLVVAVSAYRHDFAPLSKDV